MSSLLRVRVIRRVSLEELRLQEQQQPIKAN